MWHPWIMRIVVCVKHVPDVQSDRRFEDGRLVRGEDDVLNELDENAVEAAVSLVEENGGEVIALTMGPADAEDALMRALQMGADRGVLVTDEDLAGADAIGTAHVLSAAIGRLNSEAPVDLVITGMASLDAMTSMMPAALAADCGMPFLGLARTLALAGDGPWQVTVERSADGYDDTLRARTPVVVSVTDQLNEPRYPAFAAMKAARSKPIDEWGLEDLTSFMPSGVSGTPLNTTTVFETQARVRTGRGTIVTDSGDAGERLAAHLIEEVL